MRVIFMQKLKIAATMVGVLAMVAASASYAQDPASKANAENVASAANAEQSASDAQQPKAQQQQVQQSKTQQSKASNPVASNPLPEKKMVQAATINLQTTVTGNQEQPRVLYILPWQNPTTGDVDFESLDNEQKAVFGHVEREELRRELEAAGELQ